MKYKFYYDDGYGWGQIKATKHHFLDDLFMFLDDKQYRWIHIKEDEFDTRKIFIWDEHSFKEQRKFQEFDCVEDFVAYGREYQKYSSKRWKELPKIHIFKDNLEFLEQQWQEIRQRKPKYLIFRQHDNGFVDIIEQNELSAEDLAIMEREHKIYLNYIKRWQAYVKAHPEKRSKVWMSPADDEYESDFALYDPIDEQGVNE